MNEMKSTTIIQAEVSRQIFCDLLNLFGLKATLYQVEIDNNIYPLELVKIEITLSEGDKK